MGGCKVSKIMFRCRRSGNCVSFAREEDIAAMRKHEGYEEVTDTMPVTVQTPPEIKRKGRPRKIAEEV